MVNDNEIVEYMRTLSFKGGEGSGNFGHEGRPGEVGGSGPGGGSGGGFRDSGREYKPSAGTSAVEIRVRQGVDSGKAKISEEIKEGDTYGAHLTAEQNGQIYDGYIVAQDGQQISATSAKRIEGQMPQSLNEHMSQLRDSGKLARPEIPVKPISSENSPLIADAPEQEFSSFYRPRSMGFGNGATVLSATANQGEVTFDYANPITSTKTTSNRVDTTYKIKHGAYDGKTVGINLGKVQVAKGQTYTIKDELKRNGFRWNSASKAWENPNFGKSVKFFLTVDEWLNKFKQTIKKVGGGITNIGMKYIYLDNNTVVRYRWQDDSIVLGKIVQYEEDEITLE